MRRPSARCTPNAVTVRKASFGRDAAAGRSPSYGTPAGPFPCAIQPDSSEDVPAHGRESRVTHHRVIFHDDQGLDIRDQVLWGSRVLTVTGVLPSAAGQGRTWTYLCEERP